MKTDIAHGTAVEETVLDMRNLRIEGFSDGNWHQIVKGVSLTLKKGEVLGLIGESGAGKSSIGLAAMGYAKPGCRISGGSILFDGEDLAFADENRKRSLRGTRIAYVAQSAAASFNPAHRLIDQTIRAAVRSGGVDRRAAMSTATKLFQELQLPDPDRIGFRYPHQVSGGQLQRIMTAMAMVCKPDVIIFDEPTTALDVTTQVEVLATMRDLVDRHNTAAIYITHDLAVVAQMAHRIMVLKDGAVVEEAETRDMLSCPKEAYTRSLWSVRDMYKPPEARSELILKGSNLSVEFGAVKALDKVNITVPKGSTVSIVGESGSGKTTLARALMGLVPQTTGSIEFDGKPLPINLRDRNRSVLQKIQLVHQMPDTAMNPRRTVQDIIARPLRHFHGYRGRRSVERVSELLELVELGGDICRRLPHELSGGQKQRICIARALAATPEMIVCDEVTSALDQVIQQGILKLLLDIQKRSGVTFLFITHDLATVKAISDEVIVMKRGRVIEQSSKEKFLEPPYPAYSELLLSSVPQMDVHWLDNHLASRQKRQSANTVTV